MSTARVRWASHRRWLAATRSRSAARIATALLITALSGGVSAAEVCDKGGLCAAHFQPMICSIEPTRDGFVVELGGSYVPGGKAETVSRPRVAFDRSRGWRALPPAAPSECFRKPTRCTIAVPTPELTPEDFVKLRPAQAAWNQAGLDQQVGPCVERDGAVWFGLQFYEGEGITGVGGIGRFDPRTQRLTVARPKILRDSSINVIAHDGRRIWVGTYGDRELGTSPTHGLVRYDWERHRVEGPTDEEDRPCGLYINGLLSLDRTMWVATDVGLSRWDESTRRWTHFLPDPNSSSAVRETTCVEMYRMTLEALEHVPEEGFGLRVGFLRDVERLRPKTARRLPGPR